jgi:hypothetical protein
MGKGESLARFHRERYAGPGITDPYYSTPWHIAPDGFITRDADVRPLRLPVGWREDINRPPLVVRTEGLTYIAPYPVRRVGLGRRGRLFAVLRHSYSWMWHRWPSVQIHLLGFWLSIPLRAVRALPTD